MVQDTFGLRIAVFFALCAVVAEAPGQDVAKAREPSAEEVAKMTAAVPDRPQAAPRQPRRLLVLGDAAFHEPVPYCERALKIMAEKTGAFEAVVSAEGAWLEPDRLNTFDAIVINNWHGFNPFVPVPRRQFLDAPEERQAEYRKVEARRRQSLLDFVWGGRGLVGIHGATVGYNSWKEWGDMIGAYYQAVLYYEAAVRVDDPAHPVNAAFGGRGFRIADEFYEFRAPYSRDKLRVLLSIDMRRMAGVEKVRKFGRPMRTDDDYAVSWVKSYGKGRVFVCALGHFSEVYWNRAVMRHFLDGIQFALGDLAADTTP
jgi:type 1 glutamine amidotransferase